jgi:uncharacterized protein (DUF4415 family)
MTKTKIRLPAELIEMAKIGRDDDPHSSKTDEGLTLPKPFTDALRELAANFREGRREGKRVVMLPIDADIVEAFLETGEGWTQRIEAALRSALARKKS